MDEVVESFQEGETAAVSQQSLRLPVPSPSDGKSQELFRIQMKRLTVFLGEIGNSLLIHIINFQSL